MKKALKVVGNILIWLFVAFSALVTVMSIASKSNKNNMPNLFGKMPISVVSDSMKPTFSAGDLIIGQALTPEQKRELKIGDIITYYTDLNGDGRMEELNTHRIVGEETRDGYKFYTTQGDNKETNKSVDDPVRYDLVVGKYTGVKIPFAGTVFEFLRKPIGFLIFIVVPLILFFLYEIYKFITVIIAMKSNKSPPVDEEEIKRRAVAEYLASQNAKDENSEPDGT